METEVEILLVEDSASDAEMTIRALRKNHLANRLLHLKDGAEALDFLFAEGKYVSRNMDNLPKVILLDLKMPKVSGIQVLRRLKSDKRTQSIPVVMLTSSGENPDIEECYRLGVNSYVVKPVQFEKFAKEVADLGFYWMLLNQPPRS